MEDHPVLVPGTPFTIRWLRHIDGVCYGKEFYETNPACKAALLAQARQMAVKGVVAKQPENGHRLQGRFSDIYEMKPGDYRFMVFRNGNNFYITNGAPKAKKNRQEADWEFARNLRDSFFARLRPR